jgi:hypothetical protein
MQRYHKDLYFPESDKVLLLKAINRLNFLRFKTSEHSFDRFNERLELSQIGDIFKQLSFNYSDLFEYYKEGQEIIKLCFRISLNSQKDIIFILNSEKLIVTVYLNNKGDNHFTLNPKNYTVEPCKV